MAFAGYPAEKGYTFLVRPGGSAGHHWNEPGFDDVTFTVEGEFKIHILDNKSLAKAGNVSSATAMTKNLVENLDDLINHISSPILIMFPVLNRFAAPYKQLKQHWMLASLQNVGPRI